MSPIVGSLANGSAQGYGGLRSFAPDTAFDSIATASGSGSSSSITFSSIPSTYKHLQIRMIGFDTTSVGGNTLLTFNGDTANNYSYHFVYGSGSAVTASSGANTAYIYANFAITDQTYPTVAIIDIIDYASTTKYKTVRSFSGEDRNNTSGGQRVTLQSGAWRSTSAVNSITLSLDTGNFATSAKFALYGIKG